MLEAGRRPELRDLAEHWDTTYREALAELVGDELDVDVAGYLLDGALIGQLSFPTEDFAETTLRPLLAHAVRASDPGAAAPSSGRARGETYMGSDPKNGVFGVRPTHLS